jgi:hypothetical protein
MKLRYEVYGFTDEEGGEAKARLLATYADFADAIGAAELSTMTTHVVDGETDEVLWDWDTDKVWNSWEDV